MLKLSDPGTWGRHLGTTTGTALGALGDGHLGDGHLGTTTKPEAVLPSLTLQAFDFLARPPNNHADARNNQHSG